MGTAAGQTKLAPASGSAAWLPSDFPDDTSWTFGLSERERDAITQLVAGADGDAARAILKESADRCAELLVDGPGFVRLRDFPTGSMSDEQRDAALVEFGRMIGQPVGQDRSKTELIANIRDERLAPGPSVRRFQTSEAQPFHSDASDFVGLLCVMPAVSGGESKIVSAQTVINELLARDAALAHELTVPLPWSRHTEERENEKNYFMLAPIDCSHGTPRLSLIPWFIRQSQVHADAPRLTPAQNAALDLADEIMNDPRLCITMNFERGDLQFLNNTTVLHARNAYTDADDPELRRHLLRVWLVADQPVSDSVLHR